jgi:hypothetical protein
MTAPVIEQPDVEAWVWENVRHLPGVSSFTYTATQLDPAGWIFAWFVQVDVHLKRKGPARQAAERARQIIVSLADRPWADGTVCYVQPVEGPFFNPDPDDGQPGYTARYEIRAHPIRHPAASPP